jgi:hypothetical protein
MGSGILVSGKNVDTGWARHWSRRRFSGLTLYLADEVSFDCFLADQRIVLRRRTLVTCSATAASPHARIFGARHYRGKPDARSLSKLKRHTETKRGRILPVTKR